jgi:transcription antitermination factor NusA-like protein
MMVGMNENAIGIIRNAFRHVRIKKLVVQHDADLGEDVAVVYVPDDELAAALGENGCNARKAAMESGINVEIRIAVSQD